MDTITYNLTSKKAKIKGVATQQGDGWLVGGSVKKMPDNTVNIENGKYTTCDETDHPHFYLAMTKAKVIPGKKVVTGPAYLVMEDVPIYFLGIPEGFFPINMGPKSGLQMPTYGEEYTKGFFLRDMGYYFTLGDYADLAVRGGFYTLGSWEASAASRYIKRYKYSGSFNMQYSNIKTGEKGEPDYIKQSNFRIQWTHSQDPKANPGSTFSASVNFATSGYSKYSATNLNDILSTQTNSSIAYSKNWAGTPFSLSANMSISQNSQNKSLSVTLPTVVFNVSRFYPFKRKEKTGKDRWYEKISMQYTGNDQLGEHHRGQNILEGDARQHEERHRTQHPGFGVVQPLQLHQHLAVGQLQREVVFQKGRAGMESRHQQRRHAAGAVRLLPSVQLQLQRLDIDDRVRHVRLHQKRRDRKIQAIRHTITPSIGFSYAPTSGDPKYGYQSNYQSDSTGTFRPLFALFGQCLRRPQFGTFDVDELRCRRTWK
ncbi:MAG: putative LPS assembly protein LptD [Alistipes sp.]